MAVSAEQFIESLSITGLLVSGDLDKLRAELAARKPAPDVETLAKELVKAGKLTMFQANAIYKGKAKGLVCGEYILIEKIGAGGMGQVFKARHKRMNRIVAVKLLAPHAMAGDKEKAVKRFYQEVETAARLVHPNIVIAHDAGEANGLHYLVMEHIEGQDLSTALKPNKKLPLDQTLHIVLQAARGLEYAHGKGVVHRDIKPSNLLMDKSGVVKILDMGLARVEDALTGADRAAGAGLTQSGEIMGTVDYMAPEQARNTRDADARADIYSLGCTLYRLATGRVVFDGETMVDKILGHYEKPVPPLGKYCEGVSHRLEYAFERMLAKKPEERFQSMTEVITELEACRADVPEEEHEPLVTDEGPAEHGLESLMYNAGDAGSSQKKMPLPPVPQRTRARAAEGMHQPAVQRSAERGTTSNRLWMYAGGGLAGLLLIGAVISFLMRDKSSPTVMETAPVAQAEPTTPSASVSNSFPATIPAPPDSLPSVPNVTPSTTPAPPPTQPAQQTEPAVAASPPAAIAPSIPPEGIDLLKLVDLKRDVGEGDWSLDASTLEAPRAVMPCRLQFPYAPPAEYDLHVEAETNGASRVGIGLVVGSSRTSLYMDQQNRVTGLGHVDGKAAGDKTNPTRLEGAAGFGPGKPMTIVCEVRPASIRINLNSQPVVDWKGAPQQLSVPGGYAGPDPTKLFLYALFGARFTRYELLPPGGTPRANPAATPVAVAQVPAKPGVRVNLLRMVDVKRDSLDDVWRFDGAALVSPGAQSKPMRLQVPYAPPAEYELRVVAEPIERNGHLTIGLVVGSSRVGFLTSLADRTSGLDMVGGKVFNNNETTFPEPWGAQSTAPWNIICRVKPTHIVVIFNGRTVVDWKGTPNQLSMTGSRASSDRTKLCLQTASNNGFRVTRFELLPWGGQPRTIPAAEALAAAQAKALELIGELPKNASAAQRTEAARRLHETAAAADDDALLYVHLTEAVKLATAGDDLNLVVYLLEDLGRCFPIDATSLMSQSLGDITARVRPPNDRKELVFTFLEAAGEQAKAERYDLASLIVNSAVTVAAKTTDTELKKEVHHRELEAEAGQKLFDLAEPARKTLSDQPDDADAHLAVGTYLAVARDDWPAALPHLAKGSDALVRTAAQAESQGQQDPARAATIGALWLDVAEKAELPAKAVDLEHARKWLAQGASKLKPTELAKLNTRYKKVDTEVRKVAGSA